MQYLTMTTVVLCFVLSGCGSNPAEESAAVLKKRAAADKVREQMAAIMDASNGPIRLQLDGALVQMRGACRWYFTPSAPFPRRAIVDLDYPIQAALAALPSSIPFTVTLTNNDKVNGRINTHNRKVNFTGTISGRVTQYAISGTFDINKRTAHMRALINKVQIEVFVGFKDKRSEWKFNSKPKKEIEAERAAKESPPPTD